VSDKQDWEATLAFQIRVVGLPQPEREYRFHPVGRFRFDFAWPGESLAVEVEGGTWSKARKSRHTTGQGYEDDCIKYNEAALLGWKVLRVTSKMVNDGRAIQFIERALNE